MKANLIDTHLLVSRSRSSATVKVKYQGHFLKKNGCFGGIMISVSQTHLVYFYREHQTKGMRSLQGSEGKF